MMKALHIVVGIGLMVWMVLAPASQMIVTSAKPLDWPAFQLALASVAPLTNIRAIAAGWHHTCALTIAGGVKCWGRNTSGQLGDGTTTDRSIPRDVIGLTSGVAALAAGGSHTCALTTGGAVKCWGHNEYGQLGDGTTTQRQTPVDVVGLGSGVIAITAGRYHSCALTDAGSVKCWGWNSYGQLGDGTTTDRTTPVNVSGLTSGVVAIAGGGWHTCALTTAGGVKCWGWNFSGQLGDGTTTSRSAPVNVSGMTSGIAAIAAGGQHTCALTNSGGVKCWGNNDSGQLGDGTTTDRRTPVNVSGLTSGIAAIATGHNHSIALAASGGVKAWGENDDGQLGDGTTTNRTTPVDVGGLASARITPGVAAIAAGYDHTCALTTAGGVKSWGHNGYGQLGDGTMISGLTPVDVIGLTSDVATVEGGFAHTCAATTSGRAKCWGKNLNGQLGDGSTIHRIAPVDVSGLPSDTRAMAAGGTHTCALTTAGGVKCWGNNLDGQLGDGTTIQRTMPVNVSGLASGVAAIAAGYDHTCALTTAGGVKCWGNNVYGQLGDGTATPRTTPVNVSGLTSGVAAIAAGWYHTCALTTAGAIKCWGYNAYGQLGDGTTSNRKTPVNVSGLTSGVAAIAAGGYHTCALTTAGAVKCWGRNDYGQLGDGTTTQRTTPVDVSGLAGGVAAITVDGYHSCVLTTAGMAKCWGCNRYGELGDGTTTDRSTPVDVIGLGNDILMVRAGAWHNCALITGGGLKCWGSNHNGQLGNGAAIWHFTPVDVVEEVPATATPTVTWTATSTPSPTPTLTPTHKHTATRTPTPTWTSTPSPTATFTPAPTATGTASATPTSAPMLRVYLPLICKNR